MSVLRYFASYMEQHLMKVSAGAQGWTLGGSWLDHSTWASWTPCLHLWPSGCTGLCPVVGTPLRGYQLWCCVYWWKCFHVCDQWLMQTLLSKGGDLPSIDDLGQPALLLLQWVKTDQALLMLFSNGTLQVCMGDSGDAQTLVKRRPFGGVFWSVLDLVCHSSNGKSSYENSCGCKMLHQYLELLIAAFPAHGET